MSDAAPPVRLPPLEAVKALRVGTYIAEQRPGGEVDLVTAAPSASDWLDAKASPHRRKFGGLPESRGGTRCTVLAALVGRHGTLCEDDPPRTADTRRGLPPSRHRQFASDRAECRLYPGRCSGPRDLPDDTVPSDQEFRKWLTPLHAKPGVSAAPARPAFLTDLPSEHKASPKSPRKLPWRVFLLRKTFEETAVTKAHAVNCLMSCLDLELSAAEEKVEAAYHQPFVLVGVCHGRAGAVRIAGDIQDEGLKVAVTAFDEPSDIESPNLVRPDFHDVFHISLRGTDVWRPPPRLGSFATLERLRATRTRPHNQNESQRRHAPDVVDDTTSSLPDSDNSQGEQPGLQNRGEENEDEGDRAAVLARRSGRLWKKRTAVLNHSAMPKASDPSAPQNGEKWDEVLEAVLPKTNISLPRKEGCQLLRLFVYGRVGNEHMKTQREKDKVFYENVGSLSMVESLFSMWVKLDRDSSGRVNIEEFQSFAKRFLHDKSRLGTDGLRQDFVAALVHGKDSADESRFVHKMCDKLSQLLLGQKSSFSVEDMMRLIWPCANVDNLKTMKSWGQDFLRREREARKARVTTPPLLPKDELDGLRSVFEHFDEDRSGQVTLTEMVTKGLIYHEQKSDYIADYDLDGDGMLDVNEFCEMLCPAGYRAHAEALIGSMPNGIRVTFDSKRRCWYPEAPKDAT